MTRHGADRAIRLQRAAGQLKSATTYLETISAEEGIAVPLEIHRAVAEIRQWTRTLGAHDPAPRSTIQAEIQAIPARPRPRHLWRTR